MLAYCGVVLMAAMLCARAGSRWQLGAQSLDTDLDSLLCSPRNYPGIIIDIRESMEKGAELLDGLWTKTVDGCLSGCCNTRGCDLALFKNEGASKTGKNCYYVHCGTVENCVMVQHSSFTTIALLNEDTRSDLSEETRTGHPSRTGHAPMAVTVATTATPTPATTATPTPAPTMATELHTTTAAPSGTTPPSDGPGEVSSPSEDGGVAPGNASVALGDGDKTPSNGSTPSPGQIKKGPGKSKVDDSRGKGSAGGGEVERAQTGGDDDCNKYGCDGSGVVAVVVVGVICFAIVLVVVAILMKKVVDDRRKRKFRNVDYLINGMYT